MRKFQQKQILDLLQTLDEAQSAGLFADCQECVLQVGEFIESIKGVGTQTVALLEEYYKMLYQASIGEISNRQLRIKHIEIENSAKNELKPNKIEVAFFSYNASMSDSLESIYLTAKADPHCDAFWIPIPYFERNANGSFGTMYFDGADCYSKDIECTDWQKYDVESRHPDVIFTFNPYDAGNYVTSVHPDFYCERLRNLTDLLVYIPYFVVADDVPKHFVIIAGCVYAHKVIVQSEKVRDTYIRVFKENFGNKFGRPEDKFVALGSPKFDKIINTKREDCNLPDDWRELIGNKKVVFYNTSVGSILAGNEQYLNKLRSVLDTFRGRDDVVLWWRPHPLSLQTYKSMRPGLAEEYRVIVTEYRLNGFGIYDDTSDLHRAIALSDAYFGDGSSVVELYKATGKPIVYQKLFPNKHELANGFVKDNHLYSAYFYIDAVADVDLETGEVESTPLNKESRIYHYVSYFSVADLDDGLLLIPFYGSKFLKYSFSANEYKEFNLTHCKTINFRSAVRYKQKIYIIPDMYPAIGIYDIATDALEFNPIPHDTDALFQVNGGALVENKIILACENPNCVIEFDCDTGKYRRIDKINNCRSVCYDGENCWFGRKDKKIVRLSIKGGKVDVLDNFPNNFETADNYSLSYARYVNNFVVFGSYIANMILRIDVKTNEITELNLPEIEREFHSSLADTCYFIANDNTFIYIYSRRQSAIIKVDVALNTYEVIKPKFPANFLEDLEKLEISEPFGSYEQYRRGQLLTDDVYSMQYLISHLPYTYTEYRENTINAGRAIYGFVKKQILSN